MVRRQAEACWVVVHILFGSSSSAPSPYLLVHAGQLCCLLDKGAAAEIRGAQGMVLWQRLPAAQCTRA